MAFTLVEDAYCLTVIARPADDRNGGHYFQREVRLETTEEPPRALTSHRLGAFRWNENDAKFPDRILGAFLAKPDRIYFGYSMGEGVGLYVLQRDAQNGAWTMRTDGVVIERMGGGTTTVAKAFQVVFSNVNPSTGAARADLYALKRAGDTSVERLVFLYNPDAPPGRRSWKPDHRTDQLLGPLLFGDED